MPVYKINDYVTITRLKNGKAVFSFTSANEDNAYRLLKSLGYCYCKPEGERVFYYLRTGNSLTLKSVLDIKQAFIEFLKTASFSDYPKDLEFYEVLNWCYTKHPVKENAILKDFLQDSLTAEEVHKFKMKTDVDYAYKYRLQSTLKKFEEWKLLQSKDVAAGFCKDSPLFYKNLGGNMFLVFSQYNSTSKDNSGFDCWLASFTNEKHVGNKKPSAIKDIRLSFNLERDFELIKNYV